ncbi:hypothetical protein P9386_18040 [Caldifermentibacillus hisashii]|uniref:hypothetical protein n=1 Tax=Caldifermentibacillus hisashii TaxID=996558 RepID=UPI002E2398AD|nr:hypothetical protein [Caldifermentibacillus hisashii]
MAVEENEVIYYINTIAQCELPTFSYSSNVVSYGGIHTELTLSIELKRNIDDNEVTFINTFKENPSTIASVTHFITDKEKYIWGSDNDLSDEEENSVIDKNVYTSCPNCGRGISHANDAGNGFCTLCSQ